MCLTLTVFVISCNQWISLSEAFNAKIAHRLVPSADSRVMCLKIDLFVAVATAFSCVFVQGLHLATNAALDHTAQKQVCTVLLL